MASNIRVELKPLHPNATREQAERNFRGMFAAFKRRVNDLGILTEYNQKQVYESRSQKLRRKRKESELQRRKEAGLQTRLRESFGQG
jgi:ribosomal protein S21